MAPASGAGVLPSGKDSSTACSTDGSTASGIAVFACADVLSRAAGGPAVPDDGGPVAGGGPTRAAAHGGANGPARWAHARSLVRAAGSGGGRAGGRDDAVARAGGRGGSGAADRVRGESGGREEAPGLARFG